MSIHEKYPHTISLLFTEVSRLATDRRSIVIDQFGQQRRVNEKILLVVNEPHFSELDHELRHVRTRRSDHLSEHLMTDLPDLYIGSCCRSLKPGEFQQSSRKPLFTAVQKLCGQVILQVFAS